MRRGSLRILSVLVLLFSSISSQAADIPDTSLSPLKFLVGDWKGTDAEGKAYTLTYAVSSGGTTLTEILTPPDSPAMTTIYYSDGDHLMLTHYCSLNNQPRMRAGGIKDGTKTVAFTFVDATNLKHPTDVHMRQLSLEIKDHDHFTQTWILSKAGKDVPKVFAFERVN
ncbi:MAG: uncharacterized protein K0S45_920 [Nitrospira sp.]|jgi:hypothetical protein|nr:uncharacterized protein [Nitrospira sp.]